MSVCVLGSLNLDIVCQVEQLPAPGETVAGQGVNQHLGGKGLNQAMASALWGASTTILGAIGRDAAGEWLLSALEGASVDVSGVLRAPEGATGRAFIFVSAAGENMIVVDGGANQSVSAATVERATSNGAGVLLSQLETPIDAIEAFFNAGEAQGAIRILNAAPALAEAAGLFPLADIIVINQTELTRYAGADLDDIEALARRLLSRPDQTVVVTLGAEGAAAVGLGDSLRVGGRAAAVVDTTGAGDCFCGVMAAALSEGLDLRGALGWANAAAALSTQTRGAAASMPTRAQVEAFVSHRPAG
jgi:ribokinase